MPKRKKSTKSLQIQHPKKVEFIELYRETRGFISDICRALMIDRSTYYKWLEKDEQFALAVAEAEAEVNDEMKQLLIHQAQSDNNTTALIFWLKNKHPEFNNRDKGQTNVQINFSKAVNSDKEEYDL